jgi:anti-sigma-K factor RskA
METGHDEIRDLIAPYVLGAIAADEVSPVRAHILACDECLAEAESLSAVTTSLALAAEPVSLPEGFSDRVLTRIRSERAAPAPRPRRFRFASLVPAAVAGVVALLLAVALLDARSDVAREREAVAAVLSGTEGVRLAGEGNAAGRMVATDEGGLFVAAGLRETPEDRTYQLWLLEGSCATGPSEDCETVSAGTFDITEGVAIVETTHSPERFEGAAVTVEPEGGSAEPSTDPVISSI